MQAMQLKAMFPSSTAAIGPNHLTWTGTLKPTELSADYRVRIEHTSGRRPRISVLEPKLELGKLKKLPHVFEGDELCVYYRGEWDSSSSIATTITPWISEWLLQYELAKVTGEWGGGGHEVVRKDPERHGFEGSTR